MTNPSLDSRSAHLLSLSVHELRSPLTVAAGYIRMLMKGRGGALNDQQRRLLEEAEKSCARLSVLIAEMSDLSNLEAGSAPCNRSITDLHALLSDVVKALPEIPDRHIDVDLSIGSDPATVRADPVRLKGAITSILIALRRELVTSTTLFVRERTGEFLGKPASWMVLGDGDRIGALETATPETLTTFDEWRGGCGLSLPMARRIIDGLGGAIWSLPDATQTRGVSMAAAVIVLPRA